MSRPAVTPGSLRHSVTILLVIGAAAVALLGLADGVVAAGTGLALVAVVALGLARYAVGGGAQDSGYRKPVRLLGTYAPALGEWRSSVSKALGKDANVHFAITLRPQLQRLFSARLAERHGVDMYRSPQAARPLVGPELWPWLDPAAGPPGTAPTEAVLRELLDRLEAL
jgi:hypothetical protein